VIRIKAETYITLVIGLIRTISQVKTIEKVRNQPVSAYTPDGAFTDADMGFSITALRSASRPYPAPITVNVAMLH